MYVSVPYSSRRSKLRLAQAGTAWIWFRHAIASLALVMVSSTVTIALPLDGRAPPSPLQLNPTTVTVGVGATVSFAASGGVRPYSWSVTNNSTGAALSNSASSAVTYTAGGVAGVDTIELTDFNGNTVDATVTVASATLSGDGAFPPTQSGWKSAPKLITLTNRGPAPISVVQTNLVGDGYQVDTSAGTCFSTGSTLAAGGSCVASVVFAPRMGQPGTAINGSLELQVASSGVTSTSTKIFLSGTPLAPTATLDGDGAFAPTQFGAKSAAKLFVLTNTGPSTFSLVRSDLVGDGYLLDVNSSTCFSHLKTVDSKDTCVVSVAFAPLIGQAGTAINASIAIVIASGTVESTSTRINLSGTPFLATASLAGDGAFPATQFGGQSAPKKFTLTNTGPSALSVMDANIIGGSYQIDRNPGTCFPRGTVVDPGGNCTAYVVFIPVVGQGAAGTVIDGSIDFKIGSGAIASTSTKISLSGSPLLPTATLAGDGAFPPTQYGQTSAPRQFILTNTGTAPFSLVKAIIGGSGYQLDSNSGTCFSSGQALDPGGTCVVSVLFAPTTGQGSPGISLRSAIQIEIAGGGVSETSTSVSLSGTPVALPVSNPTANGSVTPSPAVPGVASSTTGTTRQSCIALNQRGKIADPVALTVDATRRDTIANGQTCLYSAPVSSGQTYVLSLTGIVGAAQLKVFDDAARKHPTECLAPKNLANSTFMQDADCTFVATGGTIYATVTGTTYSRSPLRAYHYNIRLSPHFVGGTVNEGTAESPKSVPVDTPYGGTVGPAKSATSYYVVNTTGSGEVVVSLTGLTGVQGMDLVIYGNPTFQYSRDSTYCSPGEFDTHPESCVLPAGNTYYIEIRNQSDNIGGPFTLMVDTAAAGSNTPAATPTTLIQPAAPTLNKRSGAPALPPPAPSSPPVTPKITSSAQPR